MEILIVILLAFSFSFALGVLMERIKLPKVLSPLIVGFIMSLPMVKHFIFSTDTTSVLEGFADLGLVFIMFFVGLEIDMTAFKSSMRRSTHIAFFSAAIPFVLGYLTCIWLGYHPVVAAIVGACLSVTAEAISIDILQELGILRTRLGQIIIEAGILDDLVEICLIVGIITYVQSVDKSAASGALTILFQIFTFILLIFVLRWIVAPAMIEYTRKKDSKNEIFITFMIITLIMAVGSSLLGFGSVIGAFAAGMIIRHIFFEKGEDHQESKVTEALEIITFGLLAPFFFIWIGANVSIESIIANPKLGLIFTVIAFTGKLTGSFIGNFIGGGSAKEGIAIGWGMNARGAVELVAAKLAIEYNLINQELFSALVFMSFTTTLISPIIFKNWIHKYHIKQEKPFKTLQTLVGYTKKLFKE